MDKVWVAPALAAICLGVSTRANACGNDFGVDFGVDFTDCTEFAGIGFVPAANVAGLVPPGYTIAPAGDDALVVVRVVHCGGISVDGKRAQPGSLAQIGVTLVGPDATADIDNYTLWYATTSGGLHGKLVSAGVASVVDANLAYAFTPDGSGSGALAIDVSPPPQAPSFTVDGVADAPVAAPVPFVARWWADGHRGTVTMTTDLPDIVFSSASTALDTPAGSALAAVIGGTSMTFPVLDSYNAFPYAHMDVTID